MADRVAFGTQSPLASTTHPLKGLKNWAVVFSAERVRKRIAIKLIVWIRLILNFE
jgi:hypothetical protein